MPKEKDWSPLEDEEDKLDEAAESAFNEQHNRGADQLLVAGHLLASITQDVAKRFDIILNAALLSGFVDKEYVAYIKSLQKLNFVFIGEPYRDREEGYDYVAIFIPPELLQKENYEEYIRKWLPKDFEIRNLMLPEDFSQMNEVEQFKAQCKALTPLGYFQLRKACQSWLGSKIQAIAYTVAKKLSPETVEKAGLKSSSYLMSEKIN